MFSNKKNLLKISNLRNHSGFSLIEILAAIAIITIGMFGIMSVIIMVIKGNTHSKRVTEATTIAQDRMEDIFDLNYGSITTSNTALGTYTNTFTNHVLKMGVVEDSPDPNTKTITLDVYWSPATSTSSHKIELKTIIAQ